MKKSLQLITLLLLSLSCFAKGANFNIITFNVKWFGLGGEMAGAIGDEYRSRWIKEYLETNFPNTKGILFQEIVDISALNEMMDDLNMSCISYDHSKKKHQHIALCLDNDYELLKENSDDNFILEEVDVTNGWLRPAIHGIVSYRKSQKKLFHIIGLHLKANNSDSKTRIKQINIVKESIDKIQDNIPVVVLGDFNSYGTDVQEFETILSKANLGKVKHNYKYSFKSRSNRLLLDHAWLSKGLEYSDVVIGKTCNIYSKRATRFANSSFYNRFVSDHCPLSFKLIFK
ncbi:MAG: hypothetical protein BM556_07725 [Bacteriovorax sp. MedPE-SWde]|nr:MAG: hypothetical protein BM556_07725 [Bacteriovorax sp. MedPE-SWde]